jgi:hypothetical protein
LSWPTAIARRGKNAAAISPDALAAVKRIDALFDIERDINGLRAEERLWLWELKIDMLPEDGCLRVYGVGEDGVPAFTDYGIEGLKQIIADERAAGRAPPPIQSTK